MDRAAPDHRRFWGVYLTDRARPLNADIEKIVLHTRIEMLRGLSPEQQHFMVDSLQRVKSNLSVALTLDPVRPGVHPAEHASD